ncbi:MAG: GNAT family N-acetyltransferase [Nocardioides sp.]
MSLNPRPDTATRGSAVVDIRELTRLDDLESASALLGQVWDRAPDARQVTTSLLRAFTMTGHYVAGAFVGTDMVGAAVGFAALDGRSLHSHIAGVVRSSQARSVGYQLKQHQRRWAIDHGIDSVTWTFDPLVRRNAYFNLVKLGARATSYLANFYGDMHDGLNNGEESDRLLVEWDVTHPQPVPVVPDLSRELVVLDATGRPSSRPWSGGPALVSLPADIEAIRAADEGLARAWRTCIRGVLSGCLADGGYVAGFDRDRGYLMDSRR